MRVLVASLLASWLLTGCGDGTSSSGTGSSGTGGEARLDLLLDTEHVVVTAGGRPRRLETGNDLWGVNPDRDELPVLLERPGELQWRVADGWGARIVAGPALFRMDVARRLRGTGTDRSACSVRVTALTSSDGEPVQVVVDVPVIEPDPAADDRTLRDGPVVSVELALPAGSLGVAVTVEGEPGRDPDARVLLLEPHVATQATLLTDDGTITFDQTWPLLHRIDGTDGRFHFAFRRDADDQRTNHKVPLMSVEGAFRGRAAAVLLEGREVRLRTRVDVEPGQVLATEVAIDPRLPPDTAVDVVFEVAGERVAVERVSGTAWHPVVVSLDRFVGSDQVLTVTLEHADFAARWVAYREYDEQAEAIVTARYRANRARVGLADLRLQRSRSVARRTESRERPTVLLLQVDTLRADVLGPWGGPAGVSPRLDELAARSIVWERAFAPSSWTAPTTASLLTGLPPGAHGSVDHDRLTIAHGATTVAERAREAGVTTGALVANGLLRPEAGFARGFESYSVLRTANARQMNALTRRWLDLHAGWQRLLFVHYFDTHHPFNAPEPWRERFVDADQRGRDVPAIDDRRASQFFAGRELVDAADDVEFMRQRYLGDVAWFDDRLGALVDAIEASGRADSTVLVLTSDHGEEFLEHGRYGHGSQLFDETTHVPLLVWAPGGQLGEPRRVSEVISQMGVCATLLDLLGVEYEPESVRPSLQRGVREGFAFSQTVKAVVHDDEGRPERRGLSSVRTPEHLLTSLSYPQSGVEWELYDLRVDPACRMPLQAEGDDFERLRDLMLRAESWSIQHGQRAPRAGWDSETLDVLSELGYVDIDAEPERVGAGDGAGADAEDR